MKVAAPYTKETEWSNIPDEYNIEYTETSDLQKLLDFFDFAKRRVNVEFQIDDIPIDILKTVNKIYSKYLYVRLTSQNINAIPQLRENNIKFFLDRTLPCYSLILLDDIIDMQVSDIYISDDLYYKLPQISKHCKENNIQLRMVLNRVPAFSYNELPYTAPFFSPRDMDELSNYIDVGEFDCSFNTPYYDWHKFNVYYKAWFIKKDWLGFLDELNPDVPFKIRVACWSKDFVPYRNNCGRRCSLGSSCNHCQTYIELAQYLHDEELYIPLKN